MIRKSTKFIATLGFTILFASIAVYGIFWLVVSKQKEQHLTYAIEKAEAAAHKISLQNLMKELDQTKLDRESLTNRFVQDEEVIDLLALIETLGREQGVVLETDSLDVQPNNTYFETLVISISVEGQYSQILKLLTLLESLPYQTFVYDTQVNRKETGDWSGTFRIGITKFKKNES